MELAKPDSEACIYAATHHTDRVRTRIVFCLQGDAGYEIFKVQYLQYRDVICYCRNFMSSHDAEEIHEHL